MATRSFWWSVWPRTLTAASGATVAQWCETWLAGYATRRPRTVRQAQVHVAQIEATFGPMLLSAVRPSAVRSRTVKLEAGGLADSYVYALHSRLSQVMSDAVHDGLPARNPCSRRTSPGTGGQRPYVATTEQVWALHDAIAGHLRPAILLGAVVGLRTAEVVGLRVEDVDFMRGVVRPVQQGNGEPLKSETSPHAAAHPAGAGARAVGSRVAVGRGPRRHGRHRPADLDMGDRAGDPLSPPEGRRTA